MIEEVVRLLDARGASNIARDSCCAQRIGEDIAYVAEAEGAENSLYIGEGLSYAIRSRTIRQSQRCVVLDLISAYSVRQMIWRAVG
jgi:hypothetical protein